jgi:hypothetical protein
MSWAVPFVTGHRYRVHWGENVDFTQMKVQMSNRWQEEDSNIHIMMNFTDTRASMNITDTNGTLIGNETYVDKAEQDLINGDYVVYN